VYVNATKLTLHTYDAAMLFAGGNKTRQFIPGFHYAQTRLNRLFSMGMKENPFAEGALIEIDLRLQEVQEMTESMTIAAETALKEAKEHGINAHLLTNSKPIVYEIEYATEYAAQLIRMMAKVDMAFRQIRTAHSSGYLSNEATELQIRKLRRKVRQVYDRIIHYANKITPGITRDDIEKKTAQGVTMIDKLGMPNQAILNREITFQVKRIPQLAI